MRTRTRSVLTLACLCLTSVGLTAQADWTQLKPAKLPPARSDHFLVADNVSLWFWGGRPQPGNFVANDTWRYIGNTWTQLTPAVSPAGRWQARAAFDSGRNRIVMFGGRAPNNVFFDDTWEIVGVAWVKVATKTVPPKRERGGFAYDAKRKQTVMFGGRGVGNAVLGDMWVYNGTDWSNVSVTPMPPARYHPLMCYDSDREVIVLFGGRSAASAASTLNATWEWDGTRWTKMNPKVSPPPTSIAGATYDDARNRTVMFGGLDNTGKFLDTTWEYDGQTWEQRKPKSFPPARSGAVLAYLPVQQAVYTYGGFHSTPKQLADFWRYATDKPAVFQASGTACKGSAGAPGLGATSLPWAGDTLNLEVNPVLTTAPVLVALGLSKTKWGALTLPLPLAAFGAPTCSLYTSPDLFFVAANTAGTARLALPIPNLASLGGAKIYNQALVVDPGANALHLVFSNLGESTIGLR